MCPRISSCTTYDASTHVVIKAIPSIDSTNLPSSVLCIDCRSLLSFLQSDTSGKHTLVHKNEMEVYRSGRNGFPTKHNFCTTLWVILCFSLLNFSRSCMSNKYRWTGVVTSIVISSPKFCMYSSKCCIWCKIAFPSPIRSIYIYTYIYIFLTLCDDHLTITCLYDIHCVLHNLAMNMKYFKVVNVPGDDALFFIDLLIQKT